MGFAQGFAVGAQVKQNKQALALQRSQGLLQSNATVMERLAADAKEIAIQGRAAGRTPEEIIRSIDPLRQSFERSALDDVKIRAQLLGQPMSPEAAMSTFDSNTALFNSGIQSGLAVPTPEEEAISEATGEATKAATIADFVGGDQQQRQDNFASLLGVGPAQQGEFLSLLGALGETEDKAERKFIEGRLNRLSSQEGGFSLEVDKDGNVRVSTGGQALPSKQTLGGAQLDELRAQTGGVDLALGVVDGLLRQVGENPEIFGATGSVRGAKQTAEGILSDFATGTFKLMGVDLAQATSQINDLIEADISDNQNKALLQPSGVGELAVLEAILRYNMARTLQPTGRLLKDTIEAATSITKLTGLTSSQQVQERLASIKTQFETRRGSLAARMQQGVGGVATPTRDDLDARVNEILGIE